METHQLLDLLIRQVGDVVSGAVRETEHIRLDNGLAFSGTGLLGGAGQVVGALAIEEPVLAPGTVAPGRVRQANGGGPVGVILTPGERATAAGISLSANAPAARDLFAIH